uniref:kinetochore protein NDC80 homolog isoform X2 n=1 Tax=Myxine glutinosa TaxID=7769 RepID=UPI00358F497A
MQRPSSSQGASAQRVKASGSKRDLFTPSRPPTSLPRGGGGSAQASSSVRRSSFLNRMGRSAAKVGEKTKDTRPLHDKTYFQKSTKQLCEFLLEQGYCQLLNPRKLQNPSTRDVLQIFSFLYQLLEPKYELPDKYPYPLTKSSMYTIAAPHTWPQVLGALVWLMENVKFYQRCCTNMSLNGDDISAGIFDEKEKRERKCKELFNNYVDITYKRFLQGADYGAAKEDFHHQIKGVQELDDLAVQGMETKKHQLEEALANLVQMNDKAPEKLQALLQQKQQCLQNQEKLQKYSCEMESHESNLHQSLATGESDTLKTRLELEKETAVVDNLKIQLDRQTLTPCEVENLQRQLKDLETAQVELNRAAEEHDLFLKCSLEGNTATRSEARQKMKRYQELAHYVGLYSDTQAPNVDLEFNFRDQDENLGTNDFELKLKLPPQPELLKIKDAQQKNVNVLSSQLQDQKFNLMKFKPLLAENQLKLEKQKMTLKRLGEEIQLAQQESAEEERHYMAVEQELKQRLWQKRKELGVEKNGLEGKVTALKTRLRDMEVKGPQIITNKRKQLMGEMDEVLLCFQFVQGEMETLKSQAKSCEEDSELKK